MRKLFKVLILICLIMICSCRDKKENGAKPGHSTETFTNIPEQKENDISARKALIEKIESQPEAVNIRTKTGTVEEFVADAKKPFEPVPIVSLAEFFEGNNDLGSIGCNLINHPGIQKFYSLLKEIKAKDDVQDVLVEISDIDRQNNEWPFSETVYILTSASKREVTKWMAPLQPDEIFEGWGAKKPASAAPALKPGMVVYGAWWD